MGEHIIVKAHFYPQKSILHQQYQLTTVRTKPYTKIKNIIHA